MVIRVLFADQSATIQRLAAQAFAQEKIEVIKVGNGDLAAWLLDEINPDVVIADVSLPDRNGYELCHLIKGNPRLSHIPVLLLCWSDESFDHAKANSARADAYLAKPFESYLLVENVRRLIQESGEARGPSAFTHASADIDEGSGESLGPVGAASLLEEAGFDSRSLTVDPEAKISPAIEAPLPAPDSPPRGGVIIEPTANEEAPAATAAPPIFKEPETVSYSALDEQPLANPSTDPRSISQDPGLVSRRPDKAPLVWAVLAIIAFSAVLGVWQAARIRKTQPAATVNANISEADQRPQDHSEADQRSQDQSELIPDAQPEPSPQSDSPESKIFDQTEEPAERPSPNFRGDARSGNPRTSWQATKVTPFLNRYEGRVANNFNAANNNKPADPKARILPQIKPPEPGRASTAAAKNDNSGQSPVRIIPGNAATSVAPGKAKSDAAMKPVVDQPNGFQQIGNSVKNAVAWTGKQAGRGVRAVANALKRVFRRDPRLD